MEPLYSQIPTLRVFSTIADPSNVGNRLVMGGVITGVPPTAYADVFGVSCVLQRDDSSKVYKNSGTVAVPSWSEFDTSTGGLPALTDGDIWVGNGSDVATAVTLSGDVTISNTGVAAIGSGVIDKAMLSAGVSANFMDMFLDDSYTTVGGAAAEVISVAGVLPTDKVIVSLYDAGTNTVSIVSAVAGTNNITITFSADPGNDAVIAYVVKRATA